MSTARAIGGAFARTGWLMKGLAGPLIGAAVVLILAAAPGPAGAAEKVKPGPVHTGRAEPDPAAPKQARKPAVERVSVEHVANPHLHGAQVVKTASVHAKGNVVLVHGRWNSAEWMALHRGLGVVQGVLFDARGLPIRSAVVGLQHANGHPLPNAALKHFTTTDAAGRFIMFGVRGGPYRVLAPWGKRHPGHVKVVVRSGEAAEVRIIKK